MNAEIYLEELRDLLLNTDKGSAVIALTSGR